jgi:hypothetical protein
MVALSGNLGSKATSQARITVGASQNILNLADYIWALVAMQGRL